CDRAGAVTRVPVPLVGGAGTLLLSAYDWSDLAWAALVIGNNVDFAAAIPYSFSVRALAPILISHERLGDVVDVPGSPAPTSVRALVKNGSAAVDPASVKLIYRIDGGATTTLLMNATSTADEYQASIPHWSVGTTIEYRLTARSMAGDSAQAPALPASWYAFEVANVVETFETAGSWTVGDTGDNATSGVWERAQPIGTTAAPYQDAT